MTPEQMRKRIEIRKAVEDRKAGASAAPTAQPAPPTPAAPAENAPSGGVIDTLMGAASYTPVGAMYGDIANIAQGQPTESFLGQQLVGAAKGLSGMGAGIRQVFNKATGDKEELADLQAGEAERKAKYDKLMGGQYFGIPGKAAEIGATALPAAAFPASLPANLLARGVAGAASGSAGGYFQPVEDEADRAQNTLIGGVIGTVAPVAHSLGLVGKEAVRRAKRLLPEEAATKLGERMGYQGKVLPLARALRDTVKGKRSEVKGAYDATYEGLEDIPGLPKAELTQTNRMLSNLTDLSDQVSQTKSPRLHKILTTLKEGTDPKAPKILGPNGQPLPAVAPKFTFKEARDTRRELMALQRQLSKDPNKKGEALRVSDAIAKLDDDLAAWEKGAGIDVQSAARDLDTRYREEMLPFDKEAIGKYLRTASAGPRGVMGGEGQVAEELLSRVPASRSPMRGLVGAQITENAPAAQARALTSGAAEAVMTDQERAYARQIANALRSGQDPGFVDQLLKHLPKDVARRVLSGVEEMGYTKAAKPDLYRSMAASAGLGSADYRGDE